MSTTFNKIYERAISLLDDPFITASYNEDTISYFRVMYNYLKNAIPQYKIPDDMQTILASRVEPTGEMESFVGDGTTSNFVLTTTPTTDSYFSFQLDGEYVDGTFDYNTNTGTLSSTPYTPGTVLVEWYHDGYFNTTLTDEQEFILASLTVACWGEKETNFLLDIRRLLNDGAFSMSSEANSIRSKNLWFYSIREKAEKLMNKQGWSDFRTTMKQRYGIS